MIIVDTSIWIDQLEAPDKRFAALLFEQIVVIHPYVIGEILLGSVRDRANLRKRLFDLDPAPVADIAEVINLIESAQLFGSGIGYVDAHLLASTFLTLGGSLWTRDKRLAVTAERLGVAYQPRP